jgi:hypothetical protein
VDGLSRGEPAAFGGDLLHHDDDLLGAEIRSPIGVGQQRAHPAFLGEGIDELVGVLLLATVLAPVLVIVLLADRPDRSLDEPLALGQRGIRSESSAHTSPSGVRDK